MRKLYCPDGYDRYMYAGKKKGNNTRLWVPVWARWMAQDKDGEWWFYQFKPKVIQEEDVWGVEMDCMATRAYKSLKPRKDWDQQLWRLS